MIERTRRTSPGLSAAFRAALIALSIALPAARARAADAETSGRPGWSAFKQGAKFFPKFVWRSAKRLTGKKSLAILGATALASYATSRVNDDVASGMRALDPNRSATAFGRDYYGAWLNKSLPQMGIYASGLAMADRRLYGTGYSLLGAFILERSVVGILQTVTRDSRPDPAVGSNPTGGTFPSGHTTSAAAFAGVLQARHGVRAALPFHAAALYTGWSRIADGAHRPHEVVAGLGIGLALGLAAGETWNEVESDVTMAFIPKIDFAKREYGLAIEFRF